MEKKKRKKFTDNDCLNRGKNLTIEAIGTFSEDVSEGAYVDLQVKYGLIRLINKRVDLCEQVGNVDMKCPLKEGKTVIKKDVEVPGVVPPVRPLSLPNLSSSLPFTPTNTITTSFPLLEKLLDHELTIPTKTGKIHRHSRRIHRGR